MNAGFVVHTSQLSRTSISRHPIKDGSQVLVRIISDKGGGRYEGSVAGARVTINSKQPLAAGTTFTATITSKNGQILLTPNLNNQNNINQTDFQLAVLQNEQLSAFIQNLGLPADTLGFHLLQQMKQLGMKLDSDLLSKIYNLSVKFKGKEKRAAELVSILVKKGIDFSEEDLFALLQELDGEEENPAEDNQNNDEYKLLNKINSIKNSWQLRPYEIVSNDGPLAKGSLGFFIDEAASLKLLNVECNWLSNNHDYLFSLEYEKGQCKNIKMSGQGVDVSKLAYILDQRLSAAGKKIKIELVNPELIEGTACGQEEFFVFGGEV